MAKTCVAVYIGQGKESSIVHSPNLDGPDAGETSETSVFVEGTKCCRARHPRTQQQPSGSNANSNRYHANTYQPRAQNFSIVNDMECKLEYEAGDKFYQSVDLITRYSDSKPSSKLNWILVLKCNVLSREMWKDIEPTVTVNTAEKS